MNIYSINHLNQERNVFKENILPNNNSWSQRAIQLLQESNQRLDEALPSNPIQSLIDQFYTDRIKPLFNNERAFAFQAWLENNGKGAWYQQLTIYLAKLPLRTVCDLLSIVYQVLKAVISGLVHPLKSVNHAAIFFISFLEAFKQPTTYSSIGAGAIGSALGTAITGLYLPAAIGMAIGSLFLTAGISWELLRNENDCNKNDELWITIKVDRLKQHLNGIFRSSMSGFVTGLIGGVIAKKFPNIHYREPTQEEASRYAYSYLKENGLLQEILWWGEYHKDNTSYFVSWSGKPPKILENSSWLSGDIHPYYIRQHIYYSAIPIPKISIETINPTISIGTQVIPLNISKHENCPKLRL